MTPPQTAGEFVIMLVLFGVALSIAYVAPAHLIQQSDITRHTVGGMLLVELLAFYIALMTTPRGFNELAVALCVVGLGAAAGIAKGIDGRRARHAPTGRGESEPSGRR